jgi:hypothetical protein
MKAKQNKTSIYKLTIPTSKRALVKIILRKKLERIKIDPDKMCEPVRLSKELLGFNPFEYQAKILTDPSKRIVVCAGRQVGKSICVAAKAIHFAICNEKTNTLIVSASLRQSMLMFEKVTSLLESKLSDLIMYQDFLLNFSTQKRRKSERKQKTKSSSCQKRGKA